MQIVCIIPPQQGPQPDFCAIIIRTLVTWHIIFLKLLLELDQLVLMSSRNSMLYVLWLTKEKRS